MSYSIIYAKQFIKANDLFAAVLLMGDNNVWEWDNKRRARSWGNSPGYTNGRILGTADEILKNIDDERERLIERGKAWAAEHNDQSFIFNEKEYGYHSGVKLYGRKTTFAAYRNVFVNGIKEAKTIEELKAKGVSVELYTYRFDQKHKAEIEAKLGKPLLEDTVINDTEHFLETLKRYEEYYEDKTSFYLHILGCHNLPETLNSGKKREKKPKQAKEVNEYWVLAGVGEDVGRYFSKGTVYGFKYVNYPESGYAKRFLTEKDADRFHKRMKSAQRFEVKKVTHTAKIWV